MSVTRSAKPLSPAWLALTACVMGGLLACQPANQDTTSTMANAVDPITLLPTQPQGKAVVYQVFTRLFGNKNTTNQAWGTIAQNGVGKFSDFNDAALQGIKELGTTHIWYTGIPHHAVINDYSAIGISQDDPDVVKGRAGSPYAVKDYYTVNPDLADDPANRLAEFESLIKRTHEHGMQVIIDIVPNHVARGYQSLAKPAGVEDFGASDDSSVEYARDNNFYYVVGQDFKVPEGKNSYQALGGEAHPLADGKFAESPAKWTGNGSRLAQPNADDWYETVKVNYGVRPDGSYDFVRLPEQYMKLAYAEHHAFWSDKDVPSSWRKFRDIALYWLDKSVDGFRYDMAEMVPVEFWSYLNSAIKTQNPKAFLLAEVYNRDLYRDYIQLGLMDYLYDKVDFYDSLKGIMQGKERAATLHKVQAGVADISAHMLHFLENHDEQRIASQEFAGQVGGASMGKPALVVSALISASPTMLYFGQEVGEDGSEDLGFGDPSRTSIFDYGGVPAHQRWMNGGKFDGGQLSAEESALREYYLKVMRISAYHPAMLGAYVPVPVRKENVSILHDDNSVQGAVQADADKLIAFVRTSAKGKLLVISHFSQTARVALDLPIIGQAFVNLTLPSGVLSGHDLLTGETIDVQAANQQALVSLILGPVQSVVIQL